MSETWLPIPGHEGRYEVSDQGRVRSRRHDGGWRTLRGFVKTTGYRGVYIGPPTGKCVRVHRLVLLAFIGPCPPGMQARHLDGDKGNNCLANLAYGTQSENQLDNVRLGIHPNTRKTHCIHGHEFTPENTYVSADRPGRPARRQCRACGAIASRLRTARRHVVAA